MDIFKLLRRPSNTSSDLRSALAAIDLKAAEEATEALEAERKRVLLDGSDKDLAAVEDRLAAAYRHTERLEAARDELERRIEAATVAETQQDRAAQYASAKAQADAAAKLLTTKYPAIAKDFTALLKTLAEAAIAVEEANKNLPEGAAPLMDPEFAVRGKLGEPEKTISQETVDVWCYSNAPDIRVLPPEKQAELNARFRGANQGSLPSGSSGGMTSVTRRRVVKRTYVPAQHTQRPESIARLEMPGLKVGDVPFWKAPTYSNPSVVIATLEQLATMTPAPAINPADVRTEYLDPSDAKQAEEDVAA